MSKHKPTGKPTRRYERSSHTYDRQPGKITPGRCILIVCEGAETEPNYFQEMRNYLKLSLIEVDIEGRAGAPISLVNKAQQLVAQRNKDIQANKTNANPFEAVWCVFDVENPHHNPTFDEAVQRADERQYSLAISNPSFEYWYILHFERTTRPFADGGEVKDYLRQSHIPGYQESRPVFNRLVDLTSQAIQRSKAILERHPEGDQRFPNPSTFVHLLVEDMIEMSPSGRKHFLAKILPR
jgi:hypothetical protein